MNYRELMSNYQEFQIGDTLLVSRKGNLFNAFSAKVIQAATNSKWNHAAMISLSEFGNIKIIEADTFKGVVERDVVIYNKPCFEFTVLRPTEVKRKEISLGQYYYEEYDITDARAALRRMKAYMGFKYDFSALVGFSFEIFGRALCSPIGKLFQHYNPLQLRNRFFCSEIVCQSYRLVNVVCCEGQVPAAVSPGDIARDNSMTTIK